MPRWNEVESKLFRVIKPPWAITAWQVKKWREEAARRREELGLPAPFPRAPRVGGTLRKGSIMLWPFSITWSETYKGRGKIKVYRDLHLIGEVPYITPQERFNLVERLKALVRGQEK